MYLFYRFLLYHRGLRVLTIGYEILKLYRISSLLKLKKISLLVLTTHATLYHYWILYH